VLLQVERDAFSRSERLSTTPSPRRRVQPIDPYARFSGVHRAQDRSFDLSPELTCAYRVSTHHSGEQRLPSRLKPRSQTQSSPVKSR
jgi:hypothetical protein